MNVQSVWAGSPAAVQAVDNVNVHVQQQQPFVSELQDPPPAVLAVSTYPLLNGTSGEMTQFCHPNNHGQTQLTGAAGYTLPAPSNPPRYHDVPPPPPPKSAPSSATPGPPSGGARKEKPSWVSTMVNVAAQVLGSAGSYSPAARGNTWDWTTESAGTSTPSKPMPSSRPGPPPTNQGGASASADATPIPGNAKIRRSTSMNGGRPPDESRNMQPAQADRPATRPASNEFMGRAPAPIAQMPTRGTIDQTDIDAAVKLLGINRIYDNGNSDAIPSSSKNGNGVATQLYELYSIVESLPPTHQYRALFFNDPQLQEELMRKVCADEIDLGKMIAIVCREAGIEHR